MSEESREPAVSGRLAAGTRLGKYEILRFIAEGGMGELYVGRATGIEGFQKTVALKRILSRFASRQAHIDMFLHEAKLAAGLHHPNLVQVFDIGEEGGSLFFTMEYVHGTDVRALLEAARAASRPLPLEVALEIALGIAGGLHHAHEAGIVHRDISPSNVLLAHDGAVKVTDFGVAKMTEQPVETLPGTLKGKVSYMSPEQCNNDVLDRRSDVFAIGVLLYELTTLARPFGGPSDFAIMEHIVHRVPAPPSTHRADYPAELDAIVMRALCRDRAGRYETAQALQRDLLQLVRDRRLETSALAVEGCLRELFGGQVDVWRRAFVEQTRHDAPSTAVTVREQPAPRESPPSRGRRLVALMLGVAVIGTEIAIVAATTGGGTAPAAVRGKRPGSNSLAPTVAVCAPATKKCVDACTDDICVDRCYASDPEGYKCAECTEKVVTACLNAAGCKAVYDELRTCLATCDEADEDTCYKTRCAPQSGAYDRCADTKGGDCNSDICFKAP